MTTTAAGEGPVLSEGLGAGAEASRALHAKDLELLEKAFAAEVEAALTKSPLYMMQTKATKRADSLVADGLLRKVSATLAGRYTVAGYALTELGRLTYCMSERCDGEPESALTTEFTRPTKRARTRAKAQGDPLRRVAVERRVRPAG